MKSYKYHYVYRITNIVINKHYYGDRSCNCYPSEDIGVKYFSSFSEKWFKQDQKDNPQNYKYKIIKIFETCRSDAKNLEIRLHKKFDVKNNPAFINKANQTSDGFDTCGVKLSDERKKQISLQQKGRKDSEETKRKKSESLKGRKITWTEKLSVSRKGVVPWNKDKKCERLSGDKNGFYGHHHSDETKTKISKLSHNQWINFTEEEKLRIGKQRSETALSNGSQKEKNNPQSKCFRVTTPNGHETFCNGSLKRFCLDNDLCYYSMIGISKGRFPKTKNSKLYGWKVEEIDKNSISSTNWY